MLAIYQDIALSDARRLDLIQREGEARALRLTVLVGGGQDLIDENHRLELQISADCSARAGDYATLAGCMDLVTRTLAARGALVQALNGLLAEDDVDRLSQQMAATAGKPAPPNLRKRLETARDESQKNLAAARASYEVLVKAYAPLAASYLEAEAVEGEHRAAAASAIKATCLVEHTRLSRQAAAESANLARIAPQLGRRATASAAARAAPAERAAVLRLLADYEQRRLGCPEVFSDTQLPQLMVLVRDQMSRMRGA